LHGKKKKARLDQEAEHERIDTKKAAADAKAEAKKVEKEAAKQGWLQTNPGKYHCTCKLFPLAGICTGSMHLCAVCGDVKRRVCGVAVCIAGEMAAHATALAGVVATGGLNDLK
jgi:hypothetical protein